ncbi:MAG: hypothetical protein ACYDHY_07490 [Acidiferrobacterales bacterium]
MPNSLFTLFDTQLTDVSKLVASPPVSLDDISSKLEEQELVIQRILGYSVTKPLVDYSNFANFVFFNSALDYFNITGEKILNEYPYDGDQGLLERYINDLDDYQQYLLNVWPVYDGYINFRPNPQVGALSGTSPYVTVVDMGRNEGNQGNVIAPQLSPSTSSISVEVWCVPPPTLASGSNTAMYLVQKVTGSDGSGYTMYFTSGTVNFLIQSGNLSTTVSAPTNPGVPSYYSAVFDNQNYDPPLLTIYTASFTTFPVPVASASSFITGSINCQQALFVMGSGTMAGYTSLPLTGALDDVRMWNIPLQPTDMSGTFNAKVYAQRNLQGMWRFNETGSIYNDATDNAIALDYSGKKLNGTIQNYWSGVRASGSLFPYDVADPILAVSAPEVQNVIAVQQASGTLYDDFNDNIITNMFPSKIFELENQPVLENFLYILARNLDQIKVSIDQFVKILKTNYTDFNQTPDAILDQIAQFFGWQFTGNFLNADAFQYLLGKGVLGSIENNLELDTKLFQVKNEFWRRTLTNLVYMYKTKGTAESVSALLNVYGINQSYVRLKEYGLQQNVTINTYRILAQKSVAAMAFGSGTVSGTNYVISEPFSSSFGAIETRVRWPTTASFDIPATLASGTIWVLNSASFSGSVSTGTLPYASLTWQRNSAASDTGSLTFKSPEGTVVLTGAVVFDEKWYNITVNRNPVSGTISLIVYNIDRDELATEYSASINTTLVSGTNLYYLQLGSTGSNTAFNQASGGFSQQWMQEVRVWNQALQPQELLDHALNFQSYGVINYSEVPNLVFQWRLWEDTETDNNGNLINGIGDVSPAHLSGSAIGFTPSTTPFKLFLNDYNYIASPEYGWNEQKIRIINDSVIPIDQQFADDNKLALEFNMVDALNEDISQIMSSLDGFNNALGLPANRYRATYKDLDAFRKLYFQRLQGRLNFRLFSDMLEFFDRSFLTMVQRLIPARANFIGDEFIIESHMLERPKHQWNYRLQPPQIDLEGVITVFVRT